MIIISIKTILKKAVAQKSLITLLDATAKLSLIYNLNLAY